MKQIKKYGVVFFMAAFFVSCSGKRKSADYCIENKQTITEIRQLYDELYTHQPFSAGFSDKSFRYYVIEVNTDTVRYIYNTENSSQQLYSTVLRFNYDTTRLNELRKKMYAIRCLWLSKSYFYVAEERENVTFLSFRSIASNSKFVENKYYILVFLPHPIAPGFTVGRIKNGELVKIDSLVFYDRLWVQVIIIVIIRLPFYSTCSCSPGSQFQGCAKQLLLNADHYCSVR